ncbi:MAG: hypothetical protein HRT89_07275, partial [Lentisphaeria bacterium]|nr:hypothetical protein [Lentisphaeria bacterium]NQZ67855.1 hypothetical protein [Lentisphaeria bacterium]
MSFWGSYLNINYGYNRGDLKPGITENRYIRLYWQCTLELLALLIDVYDTTRDKKFLTDKLLVLAPPFLRFYREFNKGRDDDGKILFKPAQSLETWHEAVNPSPDIAGLQWVLDKLLALDELPEELREEWSELRELIPEVPTRTDAIKNRTVVLPALQYDHLANFENPELYTVFPYRLYGVGKPDLEIGRATWEDRLFKQTRCWFQNGIQAALLGLTDEAKADIVTRASNPHAGSRFPAFWGPGMDWIPDQDHGSVTCITVQRMLMQCDDGKIHLLPAWPKDWTVDFKLHAPNNTTVEGHVENGSLTKVTVSPEERRKDIVLPIEPDEKT